MKKTLTILILMIMGLISIGIVSAVQTTVISVDPLSILANNSFRSNSSALPNINVTGNASTWTCNLYGTMNGTQPSSTSHLIETNNGVTNNTIIKFTLLNNMADQKLYTWSVFCNASSDVSGSWSNDNGSNYTFTVDTTSPNITENYPRILFSGNTSDLRWIRGARDIIMNFSVIDNNPSQCELFMDYNLSGNTSFANRSIQLVTSGIVNSTAVGFNFTNVNSSANVKWVDNRSGYKYTVICNDSAGNDDHYSNYVKVDTVAPSEFIFDTSTFMTDANLKIANNTYCSDYKPQVGWNRTMELNFERYRIRFCESSGYGCSTFLEYNVTGNQTQTYNLSSDLVGDTTYTILITAFDFAGNWKNMSVLDYEYRTDSTCHNLTAGWNICGVPGANSGNSMTLSQLLNYSGATTASFFNESHQFQSHVSGGSYDDTTVSAGNAVLLYMASAGTMNDFIRNTSAIANLQVNLTNSSNSDWNLIVNRNHTTNFTFQQLDNYIGRPNDNKFPQNDSTINVSFFSFYNNSASTGSKYVSFVANWSIVNGTTIPFMYPIWMFIDDSIVTTDRNNATGGNRNFTPQEIKQTIDWGIITN